MKNLLLIFALIGITLNSAAQSDSCADFSQSSATQVIEKIANTVTGVATPIAVKTVAAAASTAAAQGAAVGPAIAATLAANPITASVLAVGIIGGTAAAIIAEAFANNAKGNPTPVNIPWDTVTADGNNNNWHPTDEDHFILVKTPGTGKVHFMQTNSDWWKGIVVFPHDKSNEWYEIACLSNNKTTMVMQATPELAQTNWVVLSKAKAFGVHTNMYLINNWGDLNSNYDYTINWVKD